MTKSNNRGASDASCLDWVLGKPLYQILPVASSSPSLQGAQDDTTVFQSTAWRHDTELGRGYLLISTSDAQGKVWRWETGGGPIPIGKTLQLLDSGCRSNHHADCTATLVDPTLSFGSGGIAVEQSRSSDGSDMQPRIMLAEWGERRIHRLERETGARTPVLLEYQPSVPVYQPRQLLYLPHLGDLIVLDSIPETTVDVLWQVYETHKIPPLESLAESRLAHAWKTIPLTNATAGNRYPNKLLEHAHIGGVSLLPKEPFKIVVSAALGPPDSSSPNATQTSVSPAHQVVLLHLTLDQDLTGESEELNDAAEMDSNKKRPPNAQSEIALDYSKYTTRPGPVTVDDKGNFYLATDTGLLLFEPTHGIVGHLTLPTITQNEQQIVSMTIGEDKFLYVATQSGVFRIQIRNGPYKVPEKAILNK
eukprot:Nitzschia sp. Nitz4//scaffold75_size92586//90060//91319//NITZ4_004873-RA/size92586-processed-gene-0.51-mRNA-1//-1//CDS//3329557759//3923//frame0